MLRRRALSGGLAKYDDLEWDQYTKDRQKSPGNRPGRGEMPGGPPDLRLWSRPNDHKDHAVVGMLTVKAPLLHSQAQTSQREALTGWPHHNLHQFR